ncbi:MFS transporter [Candidatus Bathyarchaeota archaeon]|nr:MAG: MFS transporter [Candidatus Bathyarchaeota archaeon]
MEAFKRVLTVKTAYTLYASVFTAWISTPAYYTFLPLFMTEDIETSKFLSSLAFSITPFAEVPAMLYLGSLSDRIGRRKVIALCLAAYP